MTSPSLRPNRKVWTGFVAAVLTNFALPLSPDMVQWIAVLIGGLVAYFVPEPAQKRIIEYVDRIPNVSEVYQEPSTTIPIDPLTREVESE